MKTLTVEGDPSDFVIAAILHQKDCAVAFMSRTVTNAEAKY